ncbi:MAG: helix-turn-helix domain-containing protein [Paramuribaculum sp.]|nr:helix-turn-helix domain-containing protein [Paramuribaculum sp.]
MPTIDISRLRKHYGMNPRLLAEKLNVRQSFLSAIENGRSRMPDDKLPRLMEIFSLENFDGFMMDEAAPDVVQVPPHTHSGIESDPLTKLLMHIHRQAHNDSDSHDSRAREEELEARIDSLVERNERLSDKIDNYRDEIDTLRNEILRLKQLLVANSISF